MSNRLADETSPYLLQHKNNPVDWYPWGPDALRQAREQDKPIFLSIGYAACHWCHVMAHESFEDVEVARVLNERFVSIKVDREERPELDSIYMNAVVRLTGHGGWPMSVFVTPDGMPFYGGTYFPPTPRGGMPGFVQVLLAVAEAWRDRREQLLQGGVQIVESIRQTSALPAPDAAAWAPAMLSEAVRNGWTEFDWRNAGWGDAPKFPQPMMIEFLLRYAIARGESLALEMATKTLDAMARGGIHDLLGGGFHRYSVDATWLVPHFEKMLYDNAQLARVYVHAWQVTRRAHYREVAESTLDYMAREMTDAAGGFYGTQDADSEGEEGKFYVWTRDEIVDVLGDGARLFIEAYGITERGNFDGRNILFMADELPDLARRHGLSEAECEARLADLRARLLVVRERRVRPGLDDKVLVGWNGLMLAAFADAARAFDRADYRVLAEKNAAFLLKEMRLAEDRLWRVWRGGRASQAGVLEDYANLAEGLLTLYQATFNPEWFDAARGLADVILAHFTDPGGGFFDTADDHETLVLRPKDLQDNAVPSGNAMAATVLDKLGAFTGDPRYAEAAEVSLRAIAPLAVRHPTAFGQWLCAMTSRLIGFQEVALIGELNSDDLQALVAATFETYRPTAVVAAAAPDQSPSIPLLAGRRTLDGRATAYVCQHFTCRQPVTTPDELRAALASIPLEAERPAG